MNTNCALVILKDLTHWVSGWVDWNIVLDEKGGPNYINDYADSPVIVNTASMFKSRSFVNLLSR